MLISKWPILLNTLYIHHTVLSALTSCDTYSVVLVYIARHVRYTRAAKGIHTLVKL